VDIEQLTRKILAEIRSAGVGDTIKVLCLIDNDKQAFQEIRGQLTALKDQNLFLIALASSQLREEVLSCGAFAEIYFEPDSARCKQLIAVATLVTAPVLTLPALAKVSIGIGDSAVEKAMAECIAGGKRLLLTIDGCIPYHSSLAVNAPYVAMIINYLRVMAGFGCTITCSRLFRKTLLANIGKPGNEGQTEQEICIHKQLITEADIAVPPGCTRIIIGAGSSLTEAACTLATESGIVLLRKLN
jgi:hypothetical protein